SSRRRHTRSDRDWSSDVCSSDLLGVVSELSENGLQDTGVSRVDPFADFGGWSLGKDEAEGIVTRVPEVSSYFVPRSNHLHSVRIGKKPLALRMYDKRYQLEKMGGAAD